MVSCVKRSAIIVGETSAGDPAFRCATACVCRKTERQQDRRDLHSFCTAVVLSIKSVVRAKKQMSCIIT